MFFTTLSSGTKHVHLFPQGTPNWSKAARKPARPEHFSLRCVLEVAETTTNEFQVLFVAWILVPIWFDGKKNKLELADFFQVEMDFCSQRTHFTLSSEVQSMKSTRKGSLALSPMAQDLRSAKIGSKRAGSVCLDTTF